MGKNKKNYADKYEFDPYLGNFFRLPKKITKTKKQEDQKKWKK